MGNRIVLMCVLAAMWAPVSFSQTGEPSATATPPDTGSIVGVWRADMDGLPFVTMTITNESGALSGAVLFYLHRRNQGQQTTSAAGVPEPLLNPKFDGTTLTFQVSHRRAHPPGSLSDAPVSFRMKVTGADKGGLVNLSDTRSGSGNADSSGLVMARTAY